MEYLSCSNVNFKTAENRCQIYGLDWSERIAQRTENFESPEEHEWSLFPLDQKTLIKVLTSPLTRPNPKESESSFREEACVYLKKVTDNKPQDVEAWVELASLTEQHDTQLALSAYRTSIKLYKDKGTPVPPEIYNNTAALMWSAESLSEAEQYYNLALERCEEETPNNRSHHESIIYTIR